MEQPERLINKPLRISIFDHEPITGIGRVFIGIIKTGILKRDIPIGLSFPFSSYYISNNNECMKYKCQSIEKYYKDLDMAFPGDIVGIKINKTGWKRQPIKELSLIGNYGDDLLSEVVNFTADIIVTNVPNSIKVGCCPIMFCHTQHISVKLIKILYKADRRTNKIIKKNRIEITNGERALVLFELNKKGYKYFSFETYKENSFFWTIIIMDNNNIIAVGKIIEINKKKPDKINLFY